MDDNSTLRGVMKRSVNCTVSVKINNLLHQFTSVEFTEVTVEIH